MSETTRPVHGIETEYSCLVVAPDGSTEESVGSCHTSDGELALDLLFERDSTYEIVERVDSVDDGLNGLGLKANNSGFLSNGARYYRDVSGPEYATPETATAAEAAIRTFDGDRVAHCVLRHLQETGALRHFQLNRRNVDHTGSSRGVHINSLTTLDLDNGNPNEQQVCVLAALNIAKGSMFGSGGLIVNQSGATDFHHSPRLSVTNSLENHYMSVDQPLVKGPFKPDKGGWRVETITSDALNFAWPIRASLVMTSAVLRLLELGLDEDLPKLYLQNCIVAAKSVGRFGPSGEMPLQHGHGYKYVNPLEVLRRICETCLKVDDFEDIIDTETRQVLPEVINTAEVMSSDPDSVVDRVESLARLAMFDHRIGSTDTGALSTERACRLDYAWDLIGGGIAEGMRNRGVVGWYGFDMTQRQIRERMTDDKALTIPPKDTRARIRGPIIGRLGRADISGWDTIRTPKGEVHLHPLQTIL